VLLRTADLLGAVLTFLALLARSLGDGDQSLAGQTVLGLKLLGRIGSVVDKGKAGGFASTKGNLEAENDHGILVALVHGGQLFAEHRLANGGHVGMNHIQDHLLAHQQTVGHELARTDGNSRSVSL